MKLISQIQLINKLGVSLYTLKKYVEYNNIKTYTLNNREVFYNEDDFKTYLLSDKYISISKLVNMNQHISKQAIHKIIKKNRIKKYKILDNFDRNIYVKKAKLMNINQFN